MRTLATNRSLYQGFARQYDGVQNYDSLGTLGNLGSNLGSGFYCKFDIETTSTTNGIFGFIPASGTMQVQIYFNFTGSGAIGVELIDTSNLKLFGNASTGFNDGQKHTIEITAIPSTNTIVIKIDGISKTVSYLNQQTPASFINFPRAFFLGANDNGPGNHFLACTLDNFQIGTSAGSLYGSYTFDKKTLADSSGNGNDGAAGGSPTATYVAGLSPVPRQILASGRTLAVGRGLHP